MGSVEEIQAVPRTKKQEMSRQEETESAEEERDRTVLRLTG